MVEERTKSVYMHTHTHTYLTPSIFRNSIHRAISQNEKVWKRVETQGIVILPGQGAGLYVCGCVCMCVCVCVYV
jgi:hypothetical protein